MTIIDIKLLDARQAGQMPAYATPGSAGLDLRASTLFRLPSVPAATKAGFTLAQKMVGRVKQSEAQRHAMAEDTTDFERREYFSRF